MIDRDTALLIAEKALAAIAENIGKPVRLWEWDGHDAIVDHNDVWLIRWNSVEYLESLDVMKQILSGPIIVPKDGRQPFGLGTYGTDDEMLNDWRGHELAERFEGFDVADFMAPIGYRARTPRTSDLVTVGDAETAMHLTDRDGVIVYETTDRGHRTGVASFSDVEAARRYVLLELGMTRRSMANQPVALDATLADGFALEVGPTTVNLEWPDGWADVSSRLLGERRLRMLSRTIGRTLDELAASLLHTEGLPLFTARAD